LNPIANIEIMKNSIYSNVEFVNSVRSGPGVLGCSPGEDGSNLYEPGKKAKPRKRKLFKR